MELVSGEIAQELYRLLREANSRILHLETLDSPASGYSVQARCDQSLTLTDTAQDLSNATLSLTTGHYVVIGTFDCGMDPTDDDKLIVGQLVVGGVVQTGKCIVQVLSDSTYLMQTQAWDITLTGTTTVKLQGYMTGAPAGVNVMTATESNIVAMRTSTGPQPTSLSFGTPNFTLGTANAAGTASTVVRSDATILTFDATAPTTIVAGDSAATGAATVAARRDHTHGAPSTYPATAHNVLSATHGDSTAAACVRGDVIVGIGASPKWTRYALSAPAAGTLNYFGVNNGETEPSWKTASSNPGAAAAILATPANGIPTLTGLITGKIYPAADSTTAVQILKADGATAVVNVDTTNSRVGVGTTNPTYKLQLKADNANLYFEGTTDQLVITRNAMAAGQYTIYTPTASDLQFGTNSTARLMIKSGGNVGIGTTAPLSKLGLLGNASIGATYGNFAAPTSGLIVEGNVGLGTTSPAYNLDVQGTGPAVRIKDKDLAEGFRLIQTVGGLAYFRHDLATGNLRFEQVGTGNIDFFTGTPATAKVTILNAGNVGVGTTAPGAKLDVRGSAIFNEDGSDADFRVEGDTDANLLFVDASADKVGIGLNNPTVFKLETAGSIGPSVTNTYDLGSTARRWKNIHGSELNIQTITASTVMATIGGNIIVAPTTYLTTALGDGAGDTTIYVQHNNLVNGDRVVMKAAGNVEYMAIASAAGGGGPYSYTVTRDLDGTGRNTWAVGDAIVDTGTTGAGLVELYSTTPVLGAGTGPAVSVMLRTGTTYSNLIEASVMGNLKGKYGYAGGGGDPNVFGFAAGRYENDYSFITVEPTNGIKLQKRTGGADVVVGKWDLDGTLFLGSNIAAPATTGLVVFAKDTTTYNTHTYDAGDLLVGDDSSSKANMFWDKSAGKLQFRGGTTMQCEIGTDGAFYAGAGETLLDATGLTVNADSTLETKRAINFVNLATSTTIGTVYSLYHATNTNGIQIEGSQETNYDGLVYLKATGGTGTRPSGGGDPAGIVTLAALKQGSALYSSFTIAADGSAAGTYAKLTGGNLYINDTSNANMALGLTINQGANDDEILTFKSSDIAHGFTGMTEADSYGVMNKIDASKGGTNLFGYAEDTTNALNLMGSCDSEDTTTATDSAAKVTIRGASRSGTGWAAAASADCNILSVMDRFTSVFLFKADGDAFAYSTWDDGYDKWDDIALMDSIADHMNPKRILDRGFANAIRYSKEDLEEAGLVKFGANEGEGFLNITGLHKATIGAIGQIGQRFSAYEDRIAKLETRLLQLGG